jgi:hypothetical protein
MSEKPFWHELDDATVESLYARNIAYATLMKRYRQPDWCTHPKALNGLWGCWSLMGKKTRHQISPEYCKECEFFMSMILPCRWS